METSDKKPISTQIKEFNDSIHDADGMLDEDKQREFMGLLRLATDYLKTNVDNNAAKTIMNNNLDAYLASNKLSDDTKEQIQNIKSDYNNHKLGGKTNKRKNNYRGKSSKRKTNKRKTNKRKFTK